MPGPSDPATRLRVGRPAELADAVTRSHLADGRCVGWYGGPGVVIDAELVDRAPPAALAARYGDADFWARWTRAECAAKAAGVPIARWLRRHGLDGPGAEDAVTVLLDRVVVSIAPSRPGRAGTGVPPARD